MSQTIDSGLAHQNAAVVNSTVTGDQNRPSMEAANSRPDTANDYRSRLEIEGWENAFNDEVFANYKSKDGPAEFTILKFFHSDDDPAGTKYKKQKTGKEGIKDVLNEVDQGMIYRIIFVENVDKEAIKIVGPACGLLSGDWRMATRWLNVPETASFGANGIWMFIEVKTIWKDMPRDPLSALEDNLTPPDCPALLDNELEKWARRRIGVLFSMQNGMWTFIVLIAPEEEVLEFNGKIKKIPRREKGFLHLRVDEDSDERIANAHWSEGRLAYCKDAQNRVEDMINYTAVRLKQEGPRFLERIITDIFWGWGEFLKHMRLTILKIREASESRVHEYKNSHCWKLFRHRLILQETELLSRAYISLERARRVGIHLPFQLERLEPSRTRIQSEVKEDERLIKDAIEMIHNHITLEKADHSAKSNNTMEWLSLLAAIFLPLNLFAGIFGMNIYEFGVSSNTSNPRDPIAPHWWVFVYVSVPSTLGLGALLYWKKQTHITREAWNYQSRKVLSLC